MNLSLQGEDMTRPQKASQLLELHHDLDDIFLLHQRALLRMDPDLASQRLDDYATALFAHIDDEEEFVLPLYRDRAEIVIGGAPEIFSTEHEKIRTYVELFRAEMPKLVNSKDRERDILWLLDSQNTFKRLLVHHDVREKRFLYPAVDEVTSQEEKDELFAHLRMRPTSNTEPASSNGDVGVDDELEPVY